MTEGNKARGRLAVTNQRFQFSGWTICLSTESKTLPLSHVTSVEAQKNLMAPHAVVIGRPGDVDEDWASEQLVAGRTGTSIQHCRGTLQWPRREARLPACTQG